MPSPDIQNHIHLPVTHFMQPDFAVLRDDLTVGGALEAIRQKGLGDRIVYFYVTDSENRLRGVLPTRRLLTEELDRRLADVMIKRVVALPVSATLLEACEFFVLYKFYALPVVDSERRLIGVVDVGLFTDEVLNVEEKDQVDEVFQTIGFHVEELRNATPAKSFRYRFPWLLATIVGGTLCALLTGAFAATLEQQIVLAFFMTLVLGLGESVSAQSMAVTLQSLHGSKPNLAAFLVAIRKEIITALMLGSGAGTIVGLVVFTWHRGLLQALAIGSSILASILVASLLGLAIPTLLRVMHLEPKIASGPLTLAIADLCTLICYFGISTLLLR